MSNLNRHPNVDVEQQQQVYNSDENSRVFAVMNDVPIASNNEIAQKQQLVYCNAPVDYLPISNTQSYMYQQQLPNNQIAQQFSLACVSPKLQQQATSFINMHPSVLHPTMIHSNTNQQYALIPTLQPVVNTAAPPQASMTNPTIASTPISVQTKRGRNDTSGASESNVQLRPQYPQSSRVFISNNTPNKRRRGNNQQHKEHAHSDGVHQNGNIMQNDRTTSDHMVQSAEPHQTSLAARRFATSRYPFSPFSVVFSQNVREKTMIEDLINHALNNFNFEVKIVAYRRAHAENNECRILVFVENSESFVFLYDRSNWPITLAECNFTIKTPSIPPQLSLVLPSVNLQVDWDEFVQEIKEKYVDIVDIIRLKNKAQQPVRAVKLEFKSIKSRNDLLEAGEISIMHMKFRVIEYYSQANVLICSNCLGIGHFRKNCPQKEEATCKVCGEKCPNLKDHQCSGVAKCIHCGGPHNSNDGKCRVVKDYRAALTRNLLAQKNPANHEYTNFQLAHTDFPQLGAASGRMPYSTDPRIMSSNLDDEISKKLNSILTKVEEESVATRSALNDLKEIIRLRDEEMKQTVDILEKKIETMEKKFEHLSNRVLSLALNICTALLDPQGTQDDKWKSYWQEQIKSLSEFRKLSLKPA